MWAILGVVCFAIALLCNIIGGNAAPYMLDFALAGAICVALHLAWGIGLPAWRRPG